MFNPNHFITDRLRAIDASGIRRVFDLGEKLEDPVNLSIGQPDFNVPDSLKDAAIDAIQSDFNRYTVTQGIPQLHDKVAGQIGAEFPLIQEGLDDGDLGILIISGVSGGLMLALLTCVGPGDEVLIPDPYFVMYRHLVTLAGATPVLVDTYPDFQLTAEQVESHISPCSKMLMVNSPSNPTGVVLNDEHYRELAELADRCNLLLISDEIYEQFCYEKVVYADGGLLRCPSPATYNRNVLLLRGFSKTYGMTGWRLGYAVGPMPIIEQMTKLQQYSFVCAPSMTQAAGVVAFDLDMSDFVEQYRRKRDLVVEALAGVYDLTTPGGAFYAFPQVPAHLGLTATQFVEQAIERNLLIIPGSVFSDRDTHIRLSYACDDAVLKRGLEILLAMAKS